MRTLYLILIPFVIFGCNEITYPAPQPNSEKNLSTIPEELHGKYVSQDKDGGNGDTIAIARNGFFDPNHPNDPKSSSRLGDSLVIRKYKGYYFLNMRLKNNLPEWRAIAIKRSPHGDLETFNMSASSEKEFAELLLKVSKVLPIDSAKTNGDVRMYQINPSSQQLMRLVHEGYMVDHQVWKHIK